MAKEGLPRFYIANRMQAALPVVGRHWAVIPHAGAPQTGIGFERADTM